MPNRTALGPEAAQYGSGVHLLVDYAVPGVLLVTRPDLTRRA